MDTKEIEYERTMMSKHIDFTNKSLPINIKFPNNKCGDSFLNTYEKAVLFFDKNTDLYKRYGNQLKEILIKILTSILGPEMGLNTYECNFSFNKGKSILNVGKTLDKLFCCIYCINFVIHETHITILKITVGIDKYPITLKSLNSYDAKVIARDYIRRINGKVMCLPYVKKTNTEMNDPSLYEDVVEQSTSYSPPKLKRQQSYNF